MEQLNNVIRFINNFKELHSSEIEDSFLHGNCYFFAKILKDRFRGKICYLPIENHFITLIKGEYYDIRGKLNNIDETIFEWNRYKSFDEFDYKRVKRNWIYKIY